VADRAVVVRLKAEIADYQRAMKAAGVSTEGIGIEADKTAKKSTSAFGSMLASADKNSAAWGNLTNTIGAIGLVAVGAAALTVNAFAEFDQAMSNVAATGDDARASIDGLRASAIDAGARTVYSATEAAGAIEELAKAGVSAADILDGGLNGALDLAAAGGIDVSEAASIAAISLKQFGLKGTDMTHVADLLSAGAGKATGGVGDLGMALKQAGLVANQTGLTIEETTAGLSAFASAGMIGSDAGTSFKSMLQRLTPQSAEAQAQFDALGISAYDSQGQFIGLSKFADNLQTSMKDLTPEARNAAMSVMFGSDAVRAASVLYTEGAAGIDKWTTAVDDQGYAAETAATRLDNLRVDLEQLGGSVDTAMISFGSGADGPLRSMTQGLTEVVNQLGEMSPAAQTATLGLVGGGGLVALGLAGAGKLIIGLGEVKTSLQTIGVTAKTAGAAVGGIGAVLAVAGFILGDWISAQAEARRQAEGLAETLDALTGSTTKSTRTFIADELVKSGTAKTYKMLGGNVSDLVDASLGAEDAIRRVNTVLANTDDATAWVTIFGKIGGQSREVAAVRDATSSMTQAVADGTTEWQLNAEMTAAASDAQGDLASNYEVTTGAVTEQVDALATLIQAQSDASGIVMSERDAQRALQAAIDDATTSLEANGLTLDITTEKGRANQAALDGIASSGWAVIEAMRANGSPQADIQAQMGATREAFLNAAGSMGMSADEAGRLADQLGLIPANVRSQVTIDTENAQAALDAWLRNNASHKIHVAMGLGGAGGITAATGGYITGAGTGTSDSIPARLSNGEYVIKASSVRKVGVANLHAINAQGFAGGGYVGGGSGGGGSSGGIVSPAIYVQNPFTGEYLLAQVGAVAAGAISGVASTVRARPRRR